MKKFNSPQTVKFTNKNNIDTFNNYKGKDIS